MESSILNTGDIDVVEIKEYRTQKHFGNSDGYVADKSIEFVKFALACVHRNTVKKPI